MRFLDRRLGPLRTHYTSVTPATPRIDGSSGFPALVDRHLSLRWASREPGLVAEDLGQGRLTFLNEKRNLGTPMDWTGGGSPPPSDLWLFHLHYHDFLLDVLAAHFEDPDQGYDVVLWDVVGDWIGHNPVRGKGAPSAAWHPFCISRRITTWLVAWAALGPPESLELTFRKSLALQLRHLERNLELDLGGNHLLENLRALSMAGAFLGGRDGDRWLALAAKHLPRELGCQVLESGEHFERAPMYHSQALAAVLDIRDAFRGLHPSLAEEAQNVAARMAEFLGHILHPDGSIPLLGDSALADTPQAGILIGAASGEFPLDGARLLGESWVWRDGDDFLLYDVGPVGADHLPAHAHCDLLGIEASLGGHRFLVDSGVFDYQDSPMRGHCRSTGAHNVLGVNRSEQCDVWSSFRMGYRGYPTSHDHGTGGGFFWCRATHDAYRRVGVPVVGRWVACRPGGPWIFTEWAEGDAWETKLSLHFHPAAKVIAHTTSSLGVSVGAREATIEFLTPGSQNLREGPFCPDFGVRQQSVVCQFSALKPNLVWVVSWKGTQGRVSVSPEGPGGLTVAWVDGGKSVQWSPMVGYSASGRRPTSPQRAKRGLASK